MSKYESLRNLGFGDKASQCLNAAEEGTSDIIGRDPIVTNETYPTGPIVDITGNGVTVGLTPTGGYVIGADMHSSSQNPPSDEIIKKFEPCRKIIFDTSP